MRFRAFIEPSHSLFHPEHGTLETEMKPNENKT